MNNKNILRVLALIPPCKKAEIPARYSFLAEELTTMAELGVDLHAVSPYVSKRVVLGGVTVHPVPRTRHLLHTLRSLSYSNHSDHTISKSLGISRTLKTISDVLEREEIEIIYSPFAWPKNSAGIPAAKKANVPVVVSLRGVDVLTEESIGYGRLLDQESRRHMEQTLKTVDHVIGVSQALIDQGIALGADPDKVSVILKGVHENRFCDGDTIAARKELKLDECKTILLVGNLLPIKGIYCLIDAMKIVKAALPEIQLVICGDGPEYKNLKSAIREANLENNIVLAGRIDRQTIPAYFRACDVFVLPSLSEGSGNVIVEASASSRPCVGTDVAGIPDYIDDGVTGFLFKKKDPDDLANKLLRLLSNPALARQMGAAARRLVEQKHTYNQMIDQILSVFQNTINNRNTKSIAHPKSATV